jgi:molybdopterin-dependent oxidoreductase alpha subunit
MPPATRSVTLVFIASNSRLNAMASGPPRDDVGDDRLRVTAPERWAAGMPGILASLRALRAQTTAAKATRTMLRINQPAGFDCPGCAWPEPQATSRVEFCENGAKAVAEEATDRRVTAEFFAAHAIAELAGRSDHWLGQQGRLTEPVHRPPGDTHYRPIGWQSAVQLVGDRLRALASPDRAVFYTSGRTSNEAAFLYQLFVRAFGTNNLPDCSNMCHESSGVALGETIGIGKGTVTLDDIHAAELIIVAGQNPGTNHPRMLNALERAKRNGAAIVAVNPLPEAGLLAFRNPQRLRGLAGRGTALADLHLPVAVGTDLALFQWVNRRLLERDAVDHRFVDAQCSGFADLAAHLRALDADALLAATGLDAAAAEAFVDRVAAATRIVVCWAMGLTQHRQAVATIREIVNTALLRGSIGRRGAGLCPVRGPSNVQGDRTMGIVERPSAALLDALSERFGFTPPRRHGYDTVGAIAAMGAGDVDVFLGLGGNLAAAAPDTDTTAAALARCALTVQVSTKLNRSHVRCGAEALILPCLGRTEDDRGRFVTVEDSMGIVHATRGRNAPASPQLRSEVEIVCAVAAATLGDRPLDWGALADDYDAVRDHIAATIPGFADFNARVRHPGGFALPNLPRDSRTFPTASGTAMLTVNRFEPIVVPPGRLLLQTVRSHDQFNTTIYGLDDRYRGVHGGRRVVFVNPGDLDDIGLADGDVVDIVSEWCDGRERRASRFRVVAYPTARGNCAAYFPEANVLVPLDSVAEGSRTPTSKAIVVRLEPTTAQSSRSSGSSPPGIASR